MRIWNIRWVKGFCWFYIKLCCSNQQIFGSFHSFTASPFLSWCLPSSRCSSRSSSILSSSPLSWHTVIVLYGSSDGHTASAGEHWSFCLAPLCSFSAIRSQKRSTTRRERLFTSHRRCVIRSFRPCLICWFKNNTQKLISDSIRLFHTFRLLEHFFFDTGTRKTKWEISRTDFDSRKTQ